MINCVNQIRETPKSKSGLKIKIGRRYAGDFRTERESLTAVD
jgi:hypothetical protein